MKKFEFKSYDDPGAYAAELEAIEETFTPLVEKCKRLGVAMRIGTNHGSLSARTLSYYGDTPAGMVESAFEYARVCRKHDYHNFLFSMKASNPLVMVQAYRLLAAEQYALGWDYPLHLGVTEAGDGEDGRMKSAIGIGALLMDGLGGHHPGVPHRGPRVRDQALPEAGGPRRAGGARGLGRGPL